MRRSLWIIAALLCCASCRIGYDPLDAAVDTGISMDAAADAIDVGADAVDADTGVDAPVIDTGVDADADAADAGCGFTSALLAHYPFDGDATDAVGTADGVERGAPMYTAGRIGDAVSLDGTNDVIELPPVTNGGISFSVVFWVRTDFRAPGTAGGSWFTGASLFDGEMCGFPVGSDWGISMIGGGFVATGSASSSGEINDDAWHMIAYTRDGPTDTVMLYVDTAPEITIMRPLPTDTHENITFIGLGNSPCFSNYFRGMIDDVRIYDRVLTAEEISTLSSCL